jgi:AsmA protein
MRLGLPPIGIIDLPIRVTGNSENPVVKVGKKDREIQETVDEEDGAQP